MAFKLTERAANLAAQSNKQVNIILEIDGIPTIYSAADIGKLARIGLPGLLIGNFNIGGLFKPSNNKDLLSIKDGTTTTITQQIQADKSAASSISNMRIALVDKDNFVSNELGSGTFVEDILSREAQVYLGFNGGAHPEDSIRIFSGNITDFDTAAGLVNLVVSHPDNLKRQSLLPLVQTELTASIDAVQTSIPVASTSRYVISQDALTSYIRIDDEIIEVGTITATSFDGCIRGRFNTNIATHDDEIEVNSFYQLKGKPIDLLLKLYLSGEQLTTKTEQLSRIVGDTVYFNNFNVEDTHGLTVGDTVTIPGELTDEVIFDFGVGNGESFIVTAVTLVDNPTPSLEATFTSQYATLNFGAGLNASQVDVEQHDRINDLFGGSFPEIDLYFRDTMDLRDVVENDILFPIGGTSINRKGRISLSYTSPPIAEIDTLTINRSNITNPDKIKIKRNTNRRFYNTVSYKFDEFALEEKTQRSNILLSADSLNRIRVGGKSLDIEARGFRKLASNFIDIQSRRFIERYRFGAEIYDIELTYGDGFSVESGDIVIFDGSDLNMFDSVTGTRTVYKTRLLEVSNKSLSATTGKVSLELVDTSLSLDRRYGVISPSSFVDSATTTEIVLKTSFSSTEGQEFRKWQDLVGSQIRVHSSDFSFDETVTLKSFDPSNRNKMIVDPPFSLAPLEDYTVDSPSYDDASDIQKLIYVSLCPHILIVSGANGTTFDVAPADTAKLFVDSLVIIQKDDFSTIAADNKIIDITGDTITLEDDLGFTPDSTFTVDLVGFPIDKSLGYAYI